ncbi:hypothetical protein XENTR_v10005359 [Xenopus tropicalis]|uniref:Chromosome 1 open reading frame 74 n=1 Tax=Xenopus tropicalis TaxID=8364 RepID=A0A803J815_XENTR|nr:UPF0739 protein C1orf74 homolog isoform X1 [Xenopus tropicalis]KAE8622747.1 hypothetical protein XENTR_v10005359 [Xenopus tropicalis]KAE8622748.1 hypothetical protein XENTR_v10005359 [Xenopus tropicalis]
MASSLHKHLLSAARYHLKETKRMSMMVALNLAAEILAVDCGLKPCFLYDYTTSGVQQICSYLKELQNLGLIVGHLHILNIEETILIINVTKAVSYLETLLHSQDLHLIDVSNYLSQPELVSSNQVPQIHAQLAELLGHIKPYQSGQPASVSVGGIQSPEWNLCTMFGFLLQFPSTYWFDTQKGFENCLSFTPLRLFTVQANCSRIGHQSVQIYSFTVPECVYQATQVHLEDWSKSLKQAFNEQIYFTDLEIITNTVSLPSVAL